MKKDNTFFLENTLIAIVGHLVVLAALVTTIAVSDPFRKLVSDRVQIMEIDLRAVQIEKETRVYNTDAAPIDQPTNRPNDPKTEPIGDELTDQKTKRPKATTPVQPAEKPVTTTVVRVNRETTALNRTMTLSVIDALRVALTRCWVFDRNYPGIDDLRVVAHLVMEQNGMVRNMWFEQAANTDPGFVYITETV
ncbi:MAG: hypothetical protein LBR41_03375, partial [Rickettsiales bacterium]|nr:hypothetical protein [Rickettsiales bacterium]